MPPDTQQQVDELLAGLDSTLDAEQSTDAATPDPAELGELATRADELVSSTDLSALAAATGLGAEDAPPSSVPEAIATGEPRDVAALRSLLTLAKLSTADDEGAEDLVSELASLAETAELPPAEAVSSDAVDTANREESDDETQGDEESSLRELLQSQLEEARDSFDELSALEGLAEKIEEHDTDVKPSADEESSSETADETAADQSTRSPDGTRWRPGGGSQRTTHSTVPGAGRRDIGRRPGRFSTVRGSTLSKR